MVLLYYSGAPRIPPTHLVDWIFVMVVCPVWLLLGTYPGADFKPVWGSFWIRFGSILVLQRGSVAILAPGGLFGALGGVLGFPRGPPGLPKGSI